jgi:cobalt-zinc-cadmium efflux system outer membrane protein
LVDINNPNQHMAIFQFMKRSNFRNTFWLSLAFSLRTLTTGQSPPIEPSHTESLINEALSKNPEIQFFEAELEAARAQSKTAGRPALPQIIGTVGQMRSRDIQSQVTGEGVAWSVAVNQPLEWPGRLALRKAIANQDVFLAQLGIARFQFAISAQVRGQVQTLAAAQQKARVARSVADRYRALREVLVQRDPTGVTPQLELRILEATEIGLRRRATEADLSAFGARQSLNQLLGRPTDQPLEVQWTEPFLRPPLPVDELLAATKTNSFELQARIAELQQQGFRVDLAQKGRWPTIQVGPQISEENSAGQDRIVGIGITLPLPLWRNNDSNVETARARRLQAEAILKSTQRDLERRVVSSIRTYQMRLNELSSWHPESVQQFATAAELADRHYRLGAVPATTYVEMQKQYVDAVDALLSTRSEAIAAAAELEQLTGIRFLDGITTLTNTIHPAP